MAIQNNHSIQVFFSEFEQDVSKDRAELTQVSICSHTNDEKTQLTSGEGIVSGNCETAHHEKSVEIKQSAKMLCIKISGFPMVQTGSNSKLCQVQSCEWCSKNCHSSSDEESDSVTKIQEVEADSHGAQVDSAFELKGKLGSKMIYSPMPVIPKRGCLNSSRYILLITELHDLQDNGDFVAHEQIVQKQLAKRSSGDVDMEASLQIERAMALYFQNNVKDAKKILKFVLKQEVQLKNPGILTGRALNLLTAVYKRQGKFGNAMTCVEKATRALEHQDSREDKAELYHSYGALLNSLSAAKSTKKEAYKSYEMACQYTSNNQEYMNVKMAALLLKSCSKVVNYDTSLHKEDVMKAKKHLDWIESRTAADNMALGTKIKHLLLRSDQYCFQQNVAMAMEKAEEARELIHRHGFELELVSAEKRISHLSELLRQENEEWRNREMGSSNDYLADSEGESSCVE